MVRAWTRTVERRNGCNNSAMWLESNNIGRIRLEEVTKDGQVARKEAVHASKAARGMEGRGGEGVWARGEKGGRGSVPKNGYSSAGNNVDGRESRQRVPLPPPPSRDRLSSCHPLLFSLLDNWQRTGLKAVDAGCCGNRSVCQDWISSDLSWPA